MDTTAVLVFSIFGVMLIVGMVYGARAARLRREALTQFAARQGLAYAEEAPPGLLAQLDGFQPFGSGGGRRVSNAVTGRRGEAEWAIFDYRYSTGSGKNRRTHHWGIVAARLPALSFPRITVRPEGVFDRVAGVLGFDDINFESEEFSRRYHVSSADRRRVFDVFHPQMIEYLLSLPPLLWQLGGPFVVLAKSGHYAPHELADAMARIDGLIARLPAYVRQELTARNGPGFQ